MQIDLNIPDRLIRKLKALNLIEGGHEASEFEGYIVSLLETTIDQQIIKALYNNDDATMPTAPAPVREMPFKVSPPRRAAPVKQEPVNFINQLHDESGLSDGLGDDEEEEEKERAKYSTEDAMGFVPKKGGLKMQDVDHDMEVEDPDHEAKAEAAEMPPNTNPNEAFSRMVGIPVPIEETDEIDYRIARRKKNTKSKAKVTPMLEVTE